MEFAYLRDILDDLRSRFGTKHAKSDFQLGRELALLGEHERLLVKSRVLGFEYNVGALLTLKLLVKARILSFLDYLHAQTLADVQGILTDVLDCESAEDLLAELLNNLKSDDAINVTYSECFKQYVDDLVNRPELIKYEFIGSVEKRLAKDVLCENILKGLLDELCSQPLNSVSDLSEVISKQKDWNNEFKDDRLKILAGVLRQLSISHSDDISKSIAGKLQKSCHLNWFFMLLVVKHLNPGSTDILKKFLKEAVKQFHETNVVDYLHTALILARQMFHYSADPATSYKAWVKVTIGEMHYQLKSPEKFKQTINALQEVIFFENDTEVLEIHLQTSISSPRGSNNLILEYKQMVRTRLLSFQEPEAVMDLT